jgi:drug/metabolite transporter (DMT)-like permease
MATATATLGVRPTRVLGAVAVTVTAWASAFVAIRSVRDSFDPGALALGRLLIGTVALGGLLVVRGAWVRPTRREWTLIVLCGVACFAVYNVALNAVEQRVDAGTAAMLVNVGPILIALLAGLMIGEGFPRWLLIAGVAFAGAILIGLATAHATSSDIVGVGLYLLVPTAIAFCIWTYALSRMSAGRLGVLALVGVSLSRRR